jgi:hypothetical protein
VASQFPGLSCDVSTNLSIFCTPTGTGGPLANTPESTLTRSGEPFCAPPLPQLSSARGRFLKN